MKFTLSPIYALAGRIGDEEFDLSKLPFLITEGAQLEDVTDRFRQDAFNLWRESIGTEAWRALKGVRGAIVHRYDARPTFDENTKEYVLETDLVKRSETLIRLLSACLRLIRPMRQSSNLIHGDIREDGSFDVHGFDTPSDPFVEVPEAHKLLTLRNRDADDLKTYAPEFLRATRASFWKFHMAVQFHERGYFLPQDWKARYLMWCCAIESIYTSHNPEHQTSFVATARIKWFLGEDARLYEPVHHWDRLAFVKDCDLTVGQVVDELYVLRNYIAHGDKIPDSFFDTARTDLVPVTKAGVLTEAASYIIRNSLLKILREGLLDHFADAMPAEKYFGDQNLTKSVLRAARQRHSS